MKLRNKKPGEITENIAVGHYADCVSKEYVDSTDDKNGKNKNMFNMWGIWLMVVNTLIVITAMVIAFLKTGR